MEEDKDIELLETQILACKECKFATCEQCEISYREVKAIENLIARYKELEGENIHWKGQYHLLSRKIDVIPKSKVKEKIEELDKALEKIEQMNACATRYDTIQKLDNQINILQELLED